MNQELARSILEKVRDGRLDSRVAAELLRATAVAPEPVGDLDSSPGTDEPIAVIGMSGVFPDSPDIDSLWDHLVNHRDMVREVEPWRWDPSIHYSPERPGTSGTDCKWQGMVPDVDRFDPLFFSISPKEAEVMDPQQRLLLQEAWRAVEDAGYTPTQLSSGTCGVYIGANHGDYEFRLDHSASELAAQTMTGSLTSILAARVSYHMNLTGPNLAIDTACSSSLVALCLAAEALRKGECDTALAGGVAIFTTERLFVMASRGGMLSRTGHCHAFDDDGDGFVPSEAVGVVMLKRLGDARRDADHIYGVIEAFGMNHDGRTNGLTAPSPVSQFRLIDGIYERSGIDPQSISYVESHGTGTKLGDPIEVSALTKAFRRHTQATGFCGLGSVKSNLGHSLCASGVVSFIKVMLCLQHQQLVGNLNFVHPNQQIDFASSPFTVVTDTVDWEPAPGQPRRAGISSFGLSGTNAHIVVREAPVQEASEPDVTSVDEVIMISAKHPMSLRDNVVALRRYLSEHPDLNWRDVAFTLGQGRMAMDYRIAIITDGIDACLEALAPFEDQDMVDREAVCVQAGVKGRLGENNGHAGLLAELRVAQGDRRHALLAQVQQLVLEGHDLPDWAQMHDAGGPRPRRIPLPTYRFLQERCWVGPRCPEHSSATRDIVVPPRASYLDDHRFAGAPVVPGARWLDVMDQFSRQAQGTRGLSEIRWEALVAPGETVHLTTEDESSHVAVLLADGTAVAKAATMKGAVDPHGELGRLRLRDRVPLLKDNRRVDSDAIYDRFLEMGMDYGPSFRAITSLEVGDDTVVAYLNPVQVDDLEPHSVLQPQVIDGVFQAVSGFRFVTYEGHSDWYLPHSLEEFIFNDDVNRVRTVIITSCEPRPEFPGTVGFDMELFDDHGLLVGRIRDYRVTRIERHSSAGDEDESITFMAPAPIILDDPPVRAEQHHRVALRWPPKIRAVTDALADDNGSNGLDVVIPIPSAEAFDEDPSAMTEAVVRPVFELVRGIIAQTTEQDIRVVCVIEGSRSQAPAGLSMLEGLARSIRHEEPRVTMTVLYVEDPARSSEALDQELSTCDGALVIQRGRHREAMGLYEIEAPTLEGLPDLVDPDAVILITGGMGGIGRLLATDLLDRGVAHVVTVGRSRPDDAKLDDLQSHARAHQSVTYMQCDITDATACADMISRIIDNFGRLDGIFHCAGIIRDGFLRFKSWAEVQQVLAPKTTGLVNLDRATRSIPLGFFVGFSSNASVTGNVGQSDYAMANAFMDSHLARRMTLVEAGQAHGRSLSVNWPYWFDGDMRPDDASLWVMRDLLGLDGLTTRNALGCLYRLMETGLGQVSVLPGDRTKILDKVPLQATFVAAESSKRRNDGASGEESSEWESSARQWLRELIAQGLGLSADRLDPHKAFEHYGLDSVMIVSINALLDEYFPKLSKTLLYEYQNLDDLTEYFFTHRRDDLNKLISLEGHTSDETPVPGAVAVRAAGVPTQQVIKVGNGGGREAAQPIAIIGLAGRFPKARDVEEFYQVLAAGTDCIETIPDDRWSFEHGHHDPTGQAPGSYPSRWGGFIDGVRDFDPLMFGMSPRDAERTDPQERLFLQTCWETLQDAGYSRDAVRGRRAGVFVGVMYNQYQSFGVEQTLAGNPMALSSDSSSIANRVSYAFDLSGPCMAVDTMCSSSLTAMHLACQAIRSGDCEMALAGGVNLTLHESKYQLLGSGNFLSTDGRCRSYGEGGTGYVPGEGVGCVLLKPLDKAIDDGDHIHALVYGTAVNHGGKTNGYTVPNPLAQAQVISEAMERAGWGLDDISYIEGHGTGTQLGDPIEITGLVRALGSTRADGPCPLGSVKSNIGHLESAAGIASLAKVLMMMRHGSYVPSLHSTTLNPNIDFDAVPFRVIQQSSPWDVDGPRRALITGFGAGGSNGALAVEQGVSRILTLQDAGPDEPFTIMLSARTISSLVDYAARLARAVQRARDDIRGRKAGAADLMVAEAGWMSALQYTLAVGRDAFKHRLLLEANDMNELIDALNIVAETSAEDVPDCYREVATSPKPVPDAERACMARELATGDLQRLAERWLQGQEIDWSRLAGRVARVGRLHGLPWPRPNNKPYWFLTGADEVPAPQTPRDPVAVTHSASPERAKRMREMLSQQMVKLAADGLRPLVHLDVEESGVAVVTMDDPGNNNSFTPALIDGLMVAFWQIWNNPEVRAVVLTGTPRVFSMGGTKEQLLGISRRELSFTDAPFLYTGLALTEVPVISAVRGHASGGGFMFGLFADLTVISDEGIYTSPFTKYGFTPGMGATYILEKRLGRNLALEMMMTARQYSGVELAARGAGIRSCPGGRVFEEAMSMASAIASHPRRTSVELKTHMLGSGIDDLLAAIDMEDAMHKRTFLPEVVNDRIAAFYVSDNSRGDEVDQSESDPGDDESFLEQLVAMVEQGSLTPAEAVLLERAEQKG